MPGKAKPVRHKLNPIEVHEGWLENIKAEKRT
jgi:hypothetical protein